MPKFISPLKDVGLDIVIISYDLGGAEEFARVSKDIKKFSFYTSKKNVGEYEI